VSAEEWGLSALLVSLALTIFLGAPLAMLGMVGQYVFDVLFSLVLIAGVVAAPRRGVFRPLLAALTLVALVFRWSRKGVPSFGSFVWYDVFGAIAVMMFAAFVLVQVFRSGPITSYRIQGAIVAYLLIGLMWTYAYGMIYELVPGAFRFPEGSTTTVGPAHGLAYYSFVTLTTVGYGDITPVHPFARSLTMAEALVGQLYPAILLARLVSMELASHRRD